MLIAANILLASASLPVVSAQILIGARNNLRVDDHNVRAVAKILIVASNIVGGAENILIVSNHIVSAAENIRIAAVHIPKVTDNIAVGADKSLSTAKHILQVTDNIVHVSDYIRPMGK
jgi:hypothetical protein